MADIERYAKRKGLDVSLGEPAPVESIKIRDLVCLTPPPTPSPLDAPAPLQNMERFLQSLDAFMQESLQSGAWNLESDIGGFACLRGPAYPASARDGFFSFIERGIQRYSWEQTTQAYRQWRLAGSSLPSIVRTRNPSQLVCLLGLLARLAKYEGDVAALLLRYLRHLVEKEQGFSDTRLAMIQSLSRLETGNLIALVGASNDCCLNAFRNHFSGNSFFLLESEIFLADSSTGSPQIAYGANWRNDPIPAYGIVAYTDIRSTRALLALLMAAQKYTEAESVALNSLTKLHQMRYDGVVGGAISFTYSSLIHLYLSKENYEKAYHNMVMRVENDFAVLAYRSDLPDDSLVGRYYQLARLARRLGRHGDADKWNHEYNILKSGADHLAERELSCLGLALNMSNPEQTCGPVGSAEPRSHSIPESPLEMDIEGSLATPTCNGHTLDEPETALGSFSNGRSVILGGRPKQRRPKEGRPKEGRPKEGRLKEGRPKEGRLKEGRPKEGRPNEGRPKEGRPKEGRTDHPKPLCCW
ncbi:hypothetical protein AYO22_04964 [Fonsecaea multimorphosa]|nr:hypothetical protein AYO22_04964 [Fonsecaea multimorphosa]